MIEKLKKLLESNPRVLILGFGREGRSTFHLIRKHFPYYILSIADQNEHVDLFEELQDDVNIRLFLGDGYMNALYHNDLIFKSPGVSLNSKNFGENMKITSQSDIFLSHFSKQTIGVTGTKGKSTTVSLIYHFLRDNGKKTVLLGNIGIPPFDKIDDIDEDTFVVFEMSAHQLEMIHYSPHIAVLLNLFPEHLDHFTSLEKYYSAKENIFKFQEKDDLLIVEETISKHLPESKSKPLVFGKTIGIEAVIGKKQVSFFKNYFIINLKDQNIPLFGTHNLKNMVAAMLAVNIVGISFQDSFKSLASFKALPHRLEFVGNYGGIDFYNDSISTIPESAIAALKSLPGVDTIILGGFDRGIDYKVLIDFLMKCEISNLIFLGKAGDQMIKLLPNNFKNNKKVHRVFNLQEAFQIIGKYTKKGSICLLSPAAASYDQFHNFEHRGDVFRELARNFSV